jgi:hypothetical protein
MVNKVKALPKKHETQPNSCHRSEWDVINEIWSTLALLPEGSRPILAHVKGHQDDHAPARRLSLESQLNVEADKAAEEFLDNHPNINYTKAHRMPSNGAQLHLPSGTITFKLNRAIQQARPGAILKQYLCKKYQWEEETFADVHWEAHRLALNRNKDHRTPLIKHIHGLSPVGRMVSRYDAKYSAACPSCDCEEETCAHLTQCPAASRQQWRLRFITKLRQKLDSLDTHPQLQQLLMEAMYHIIRGIPEPPEPFPFEDFDMPEVFNSQALIGWEQLLLGRFSQSWVKAQDAYLGPRATKTKNGTTWLTAVIDLIFKEWYQLWESRNDDRHGKDQTTKAAAEKAQVIREVQQLFAKKPHVPSHLHYIFRRPLAQMLQQATYVLRAWVNSFKPVLTMNYTDALATG